MDFGDMEQYTLDILERPEVRAQMQGEFDHIFVDECQDVSQVQDAILQAIHGEQNCLFMVGDVKQSIYRFRKADPTLFWGGCRRFGGRGGEGAENRAPAELPKQLPGAGCDEPRVPADDAPRGDGADLCAGG